MANVNVYDQNSDSFKVSPNLVLGNLYKQYQESLYLTALSKPSEYAKIRMKAVQDIKMKVVGDMYEKLRAVLCAGKLQNANIVVFDGNVYVPNYPPSEADSMILSLAKTLDTELDKIVDIVVPPFSDVLRNKLETRGVADLN